MAAFNRRLYRYFSLRRDQQDPDVIDTALRRNARAAGTNLWVLFFAILIASVGLNVNSTAVIIGAMLISPLMGPIVGLGYAAAVDDFDLMRDSAECLGVFTVLSLLTSVAYFALSPLDQPQSELLARVRPTLWDVLIATFGGAAGMVAVTRRSFSNIVPGVAIATALMPPLCTAGFGIANGRWDMFAGAIYLFVINGVFIGASTLAMAKLLRLPLRGELNTEARARHRLIIGLGLTAVLAPSVWMGYQLVQTELFSNRALTVGRSLLSDSRVLSYDVDVQARTLHLTMVGERDREALLAHATALLKRQGLQDVKVTLRRTGDDSVDVGALRKGLSEELQQSLLAQVQLTDTRVNQLQERLDQALALAQQPAPVPAEPPLDMGAVGEEIRAQFPQVLDAYLARRMAPAPALAASASDPDADRDAGEHVAVMVTTTRALLRADRERLQRWLALRLEEPQLRLFVQVLPAGAPNSPPSGRR